MPLGRSAAFCLGLAVAACHGDHAASTPDAANVDAAAPSDAAAIASTDPCHPFDMPAMSTLFASNKRVFAHYFPTFPLSIDNKPAATDYYNVNYLQPTGESSKWIAQGGFTRARPLLVGASASTTWQVDNLQREVRLAMAAGITGFTFDVLTASQAAAGGQLQDLLEAANAVDTRFKIVVMPDISALGADAATVESVITSVASSPAAYHLADGRLVVSAFDASLGSVSFWTGVLADLKAANIDVAFVPTFLGWSGFAASYAPIVYGFADWGTATPASSMGEQSAPAAAHGYNGIFMMPVDPQQYRPKDFLYWEAGNSGALRDAWTSAIAGDSDWVQLVTWSDFSESSQVEPYTDETLAGDIGNGFYDLDAYYASWFLTGEQPAITHDVLYWFYRREPTTAAAPAQTTATTLAAGGGTASDQIELVGFLTAPGTLGITIDGQTMTQDAPAGMTSFSMPIAAGTPTFSLARNGAEVFSFTTNLVVHDAGGLPNGTLDLTYWSGSSSAAGACTLTLPAP